MEGTVEVRCYEELNFFLPREKRKRSFIHMISQGQTVKDMIEAEGIPHVEVDLILVNGDPVDFNYKIQDGDRVSVYPVFERLDISGLRKLQGPPLRNPGFILDNHLKKLAWKLRLLGFDTLWNKSWDDPRLAEISADENRILLTRDRGLLKRKIITHGLYVRSTDPDRQVKEIVEKLSLHTLARPFTRCAECNGMLHEVEGGSREEQELLRSVPAGVAETADYFFRCRGCGKAYWKGSHVAKIESWLKDLGIPLKDQDS